MAPPCLIGWYSIDQTLSNGFFPMQLTLGCLIFFFNPALSTAELSGLVSLGKSLYLNNHGGFVAFSQ